MKTMMMMTISSHKAESGLAKIIRAEMNAAINEMNVILNI